MISTDGRVYEKNGKVYVLTNRPPVDNLSDEVEVRWHDSRLRTNEQLRKAFALMTYIGDFQGQSAEGVYEEQRQVFSSKYMDELNGMFFHLSTATVSEASMFIDHCCALIIEHGIETDKPIIELCEDIHKAVYVSLLCKRCIVCGRPSDLHHVDAIGMGYNRDTKPQIGDRVLPLCRVHHQEWHNIGETAFNSKYHVDPVRMDERLAKIYLPQKARQSA